MSDLAEMLASAKAQGYKEGREDAFDEFRKFLSAIDKGLLEIFNQFHSEQLKEQK